MAKDQDWWLFSYNALHKQFVELGDDGDAADTKISGNEHQLRRATGYDVVQLASKDWARVLARTSDSPGKKVQGTGRTGDCPWEFGQPELTATSSACLSEVSPTARVLTSRKAS